MQITNELGQEIISRLGEYIDVDINIMDLNGKIVASTDELRIGELHGGAVEVISQNQALIINKENIDCYPGTKPGANLPIINRSKIAGVVGVSGYPDEILRITGLIKISVEIVLEQIQTERQSYFKELQWNNWLQQLLHPRGYDKERLIEDATYSLNVNLNTDWRVVLLQAEKIQDSLDMIRRELMHTKLNSLFILAYCEKEIVITTSSSIEIIKQSLERLSLSDIEIGIGEKESGIDGIRDSYRQAKQAIFFNQGDERISLSSDWKIERLVTAISEKEYISICRDYEERLSELGELYFETLEVYFRLDFSLKETANDLHIHRNTLLYRLDQIHEKVGLHPRVFHDAFLLRVIIGNRKI